MRCEIGNKWLEKSRRKFISRFAKKKKLYPCSINSSSFLHLAGDLASIAGALSNLLIYTIAHFLVY